MQARRTPKAIVIVGGFGQNAYLRDRIRAAVAKSKIEALQSPNGCVLLNQNTCTPYTDNISWTAVVRGALMRGLATTSQAYASVKISGRRARKHYGFKVERPFIDGIHDMSRWRVSP